MKALGHAFYFAATRSKAVWRFFIQTKEAHTQNQEASRARKENPLRCLCIFASRLALLLFFLPQNAAAQDYGFTKLGSSGGMQLQTDARGVALADYDKDGWLDVFIAKSGGPNRLYRNLGNLQFQNVASAAGVAAVGDNRVGAWADYDNDGFVDLFAASTSAYYLYRNRGNGTFEEVANALGLKPSTNICAAMWSDVENNGRLDLYTANLLAENAFFLHLAGGTFRNDISAAGLLDPDEPSMGGAFGDYDNDGDRDLYLVHDARKRFRLYRNAGYGSFSNVAYDARVDYAGQGMGTTFADFDNDGWLDIYVTNLDTNAIFFNNGNGTFTNTTMSSGVGDRGMGWGIVVLDYDNDMWQDIYVVNGSNFPPLFLDNVLYRNLGNRKFEIVTNQAGVSSKLDGWCGAAGDLNNDGYQDMVITNWTGECLQTFINKGGPNHYLKIGLTGTQCNRYAIGARVKVIANGVQQIRELSGGAGYMSQDSPILHFGLAQATKADVVEISWPGGRTERYLDVPADRQVNYVEGQVTAVVASPLALPTSMKLHPSYPNPFALHASSSRTEMAIAFELPSASAVEIAVFDVQGRRVATLFDGLKNSGAHRVIWNGRDALSNFVSAGIYFVQMKSGAQVLKQKLTVVR